MDRKVHSRCVLPKNVDELWDALEEEWYCIPQIVIDHLYESIPARIEAVMAAKGGNTEY